MTTSIAELKTMTDSEVYYRIHERIEDYALSIGDVQLALQEKWHLHVNFSGASYATAANEVRNGGSL